MKALITTFRWLVGLLFIFSGLIKANDALGFSYKLDEYFVVFGMDWLIPVSLPLAMAICVFEIVVAVAIILGYGMRFWSLLLLLMILFFTWLTGWSAITGTVQDCGCFGDAIPLTPWQSFYKDLILLAFIIPIFLYRNSVEPILSTKLSRNLVIVSIVLTTIFTVYTYLYLPVKDFRPYKVGNNIPENMVCPPGSPTDSFVTYYTLVGAGGKELEVDQFRYLNDKMWEDTTMTIDGERTKTKQVRKGCDPPIHDFSINDEEGNDLTEEIMGAPGYSLVTVAYSLENTAKSKFSVINELAASVQGNANVYALTSSANSEAFRHEVQAGYPFYISDLTALKTIIRSNPGLMLVKGGTVLGKWHHNALPSADEIKALMK